MQNFIFCFLCYSNRISFNRFNVLKNDNIIIKDMLNNKKLYYLSWGILGCIIVWNFYNICINAVNIPFFDEWEALLPGHLDKNLNLNWILDSIMSIK